MKGSYILLIKVDRLKNIRIGSLGIMEFRPGYYAYIGSALNTIEKRVKRHLSKKKKLFWHIDYLLQEAEVIKVFLLECSEKLECVIAGKMVKSFQEVPKFGCSDCRCKSHLFYHKNEHSIKVSIIEMLHSKEMMIKGM